MGFWKRLLGKDEKFFDLLEASAEEAHLCSANLRNFVIQSRTVISTGGTEPFNASRSTPCCCANRRAKGDAFTRSARLPAPGNGPSP